MSYVGKSKFEVPRLDPKGKVEDQLKQLHNWASGLVDQLQREQRRKERSTSSPSSADSGGISVAFSGGGGGGAPSGSIDARIGYQDVPAGDTRINFSSPFTGDYDYKVDAWDTTVTPNEKIAAGFHSFDLAGFTVTAYQACRIRFNCARYL